jgi:hypothetical protein
MRFNLLPIEIAMGMMGVMAVMAVIAMMVELFCRTTGTTSINIVKIK